MIYKHCPHPGCNKLIQVNQAYCSQHDRHKEYDTSIRKGRDKQYHDFYHSKEWEQVRMQAVIRDHALCIECLNQGRITPYHVVHHRKPIKTVEGWQRRFDLNNLVCVCERCHQKLESEAK